MILQEKKSAIRVVLCKEREREKDFFYKQRSNFQVVTFLSLNRKKNFNILFRNERKMMNMIFEQ
jgi:hypothetical protein